MKPTPKYLHRFADCRIVKGHGRSIIADLTRCDYHFIPNDLADILIEYQHQPVDALLEAAGPENADTVNEYLLFLQRHELICLLDEDECSLYPELDTTWEAPASITHASIDATALVRHGCVAILEELEATGCRALLVYSHRMQSFEQLEPVLEALKERSFLVQWISPYQPELFTHLLETQEALGTFSRLILYNAPMSEVFHTRIVLEMGAFGFSTQPKLINPIHATYVESLAHNLYFNGRIWVDAEGRILPGYGTSTTIGTLDKGFENATQHQAFKALSTAHKENTEVCRDCEFRSICFDSREPKQRANGTWYHTSECGYNPYISKWSDEPGYQPVHACGENSTNGFEPNTEAIEALNEQLWTS